MDPITNENKKITKEVSGLGGWLILPMLGLFLMPVKVAHLLATVHIPIFSEGYWKLLTSPESEAYNPLWAPLICFEIAGNLFFGCFAIYLLYLFFRKNYRLPKKYIIFLITNIVFIVTVHFAVGLIPEAADPDTDSQSMKEIVRAIIAASIWIPYFLKSERVRNTFVKGKPTTIPQVRDLQSFTHE